MPADPHPPRIGRNLAIVTVTLQSGRVAVYRGVFMVPRNEGLHLYTFAYLDPADWRDQQHEAAITSVISYSMYAIESWTEVAYDGPPHVVLPDTDLDGRPMEPPPLLDPPGPANSPARGRR